MGDLCDYDEFTWIATIVGVRGIRGEVKVKYFTDSPEYYLNTKIFFIENEQKLSPISVIRFKPAKKGGVIFFEGIETRDDAEKIIGSRLLLPDKQLKQIEKNEFFVHQLIGCRVEDSKGSFLGKITDFLETSANNVFEVKKGKEEFLIPDVPHIVLELDLNHDVPLQILGVFVLIDLFHSL